MHIVLLMRRTKATKVTTSALTMAKFLLAGFLCLIALLDLAFWSLDETFIGNVLFLAYLSILHMMHHNCYESEAVAIRFLFEN